jgi:hypothetical protein
MAAAIMDSMWGDGGREMGFGNGEFRKIHANFSQFPRIFKHTSEHTDNFIETVFFCFFLFS